MAYIPKDGLERDCNVFVGLPEMPYACKCGPTCDFKKQGYYYEPFLNSCTGVSEEGKLGKLAEIVGKELKRDAIIRLKPTKNPKTL